MKHHSWNSSKYRLAVMLVLCLPAGVSHGSFELEDPAQTVSEDLQNQANAELLLQDEANDAVAKGPSGDVGDTACGEFVSHRRVRSESYWSSLYWLQGFTKGARDQEFRASGDSRLSTDDQQDSMALWIENYCRENPSDSLTQAAEAFVDEHKEPE